MRFSWTRFMVHEEAEWCSLDEDTNMQIHEQHKKTSALSLFFKAEEQNGFSSNSRCS